jgi:hypothetical protein
MAKPPSNSNDDKSEKEARLAAALRANLRRRKAARKPPRDASVPEKQSKPEKP